NDLKATNEEIAYLKELCQIKTKDRGIPKKRPNVRLPSTILDKFLYHGDLGHAKNYNLLQEIGIKHILNVSDIELDNEIRDNFNVLWINIGDELGVNIENYFEQTNKFLRLCQNKNEKVLVHCQMGVSRSSSIILAYLITYHFETLSDAYDHLVNCRRVAAPNFGFFLQLIRYEKLLRENKDK
ncbi:unnamed protein product, partial [Adineta ricciae]